MGRRVLAPSLSLMGSKFRMCLWLSTSDVSADASASQKLISCRPSSHDPNRNDTDRLPTLKYLCTSVPSPTDAGC